MKDKTRSPKNTHLHAIQEININFVDAPLQRSLSPITFTNRDFKGINLVNQDDPVVVSIIIANFSKSFTIRYLLIDADTSYFALIGQKTLN